MKRSNAVLIGSAAAAITVSLFFALRGGARPAFPRVVFPVMKVEVGKVVAGETAELRFPVRNEGGKPLRFISVVGDCGCVTAEKPADLAPGASGEIRAQFNPAPVWGGSMQKGLRIVTNDARAGEVRLVLSADVIPLIKQEPSGPIVVQFEHGRPYRQRVVLQPRGKSVTLGAPRSDNPAIKARLSRGRQGEYALDLDIAARTAPGDYSAVVSLPTSEPKIPSFPVTVVGFAKSGPVATPSLLVMPEMPAEKGREVARMQVFTRSGKLQIRAVETGDGLKAEIIPRTPGQFYEVALTTTVKPQPGKLKRVIRIRTDHPRFPLLTVPLDATFR